MYTRNFRLIRPLPKILKGTLVDLPVPSNLSLIWNFGSLLGLCLVIQILRGVILAIHYTPHIDLAFQSVSHIMRDVNYGWLIRITHANIASFFFSLFVPAYWSGFILWVIFTSRSMKYWCYPFCFMYGCSFFRLCFTLGSDKILRGYSNYEFIFCYSCYWKECSRMIVGRFCN